MRHHDKTGSRKTDDRQVRSGSRLGRNLRRLLALTAFAIILMLVMPVSPVRAGETRRDFRITVVEDIPAVDIEENEVPLAAMPNTKTRSGVRHAALMTLVLAASIGYIIYADSCDRKILALERRAAEAESDRCRRRKDNER